TSRHVNSASVVVSVGIADFLVRQSYHVSIVQSMAVRWSDRPLLRRNFRRRRHCRPSTVVWFISRVS
ncbi:MAG: hypothetical protein KF861_22755, partial [Planctomycetaceae bacterium]|nr:hypothetical protein [Planctomycetaceae bacterium]